MKSIALFVRTTIVGSVFFLAPIVVRLSFSPRRSSMRRTAYTLLLFTFQGFRT
jgi:hypothetical protein